MSMKDNEGTIQKDVPEVHLPSGYESDDSAAEAFKKRWQDVSKTPSKSAKDEGKVASVEETDEETLEDVEEADEAEVQEDHEEAEETEEETTETKKSTREASDDDVVVAKVDGKELRVSVKDVRRLVGQDAALTRKSQEVSARMQEADAVIGRQLERAEARLKVYEQIDFDLLTRDPRVTNEEIKALKKEQSEAADEVKFLKEERGQLLQKNLERRQAAKVAESQEAYKSLTNPESQYHIPEWSGETYKKLHSFAQGFGIPDATFFDITSATEMKLLWMAAQFAEAKSKIPTRLKPVVATTSKKVLKPSAGGDVGEGDGLDKARRALAASGDIEDGAELFKARWAARRGARR